MLAAMCLVVGCGTKMGGSPSDIFAACKAGDTEAVAKFLAEGAKVTDVDENGMTPLHHAVQSGNTDLVTRLVSAGAKINAKDNQGRTPIQIAMQTGNRAIARVLDEYGASE